MILNVFISIAMLLTGLFWAMNKKLSFLDNMILWCTNSFIIVSVRTIFSLNFEWIIFSHKPELFITHLLRRSYIDPILLLIYANLISFPQKSIVRFWYSLGFLFIFLLLEYSLVQLNVITFKKFNYLYDAAMSGFFLLVTYVLTKLLHHGDAYENNSL